MLKPGYIPEEEAAEISGMTARTLSRFAEAGYFHIERGSDNSYLYPREELLQLFGSHLAKRGKENDADRDVQDTTDRAQVIPFPGGQEEAERDASEVKVRIIQDEQVAEQQAEELAHAVGETVLRESQEAEEKSEHKEQALPSEVPGPSILEQRLQLVTEMQEKLLLDREQRIQALEKEIQWLHERLEKAEQKSDRDQVLLLQETQLLRQFLENSVDQRKSSLRILLEWMGMAPATQEGAKRKMIEME